MTSEQHLPTDDDDLAWAGGDGGPCPICGTDMAEKVYEEMLADGTLASCRGRYWHMKNEHGVMEDYAPPSPPGHGGIETPKYPNHPARISEPYGLGRSGFLARPAPAALRPRVSGEPSADESPPRVLEPIGS